MTSHNIKLSVVIPAYNAAKYIHHCIDSLVSDNSNSYEIICINDDSNDDTQSILNNYAMAHNHLKVFSNTENLGPAHCRNVGLHHAKGDYIWFIDSDDWVVADAIQKLITLITEAQTDVIGFRAQTFNNKTHHFRLNNFRDLSIMPDSFFQRPFNFNEGRSFIFKLPQELWSRIYKRDFLVANNITFDTDIWGLDDGIFVTECFILANKIFYTKDILYNYRTHNSQSIIARLGKPDASTYAIPILYSKKCDQIIHKRNLLQQDCKSLVLRNIDRIIHTYPKLKGRIREKFFYQFQRYLLESGLTELEIVIESKSFPLLQDFKRLTYRQYMIKNFLFQNFESNTIKRIIVLRMTLFKQERSHNLIKGRSAFSLIKILTHIKTDETTIQYLFLGFTVFSRKAPIAPLGT